MSTTRSSTCGPESRPVAIPSDFGAHSVALQTGEVTLHQGLWWSGEPLVLDTRIKKDLVRLYEIVLTEGTANDVRNFVSYSTLLEIWNQLFLPRYVKRRWEDWFQGNSVTPS